MKTAQILSGGLGSLLLSSSPLLGQSVILFDDMDGTAYSDFFFNGFDSGNNPDDVSFSFFEEEISGGNPGAKLLITHEHDVDRDEFGDPFGGNTETELQSIFSNRNVKYNPSTQGAIQELTFSLDVRTSDPIDTLFFEIGDETGGNVAGGFSGNGFLDIVSDGEWQTIILTGITQADVGSRDLSGSLPLDFGFGFTSFADVGFDPETYTIDVDNFQVSIVPVPEPSSALLGSLGVFLLPRRRR